LGINRSWFIVCYGPELSRKLADQEKGGTQNGLYPNHRIAGFWGLN
jgi:hypothetical protein